MDNKSGALPLLLECFYSNLVADGAVDSGQFDTTVDRGTAVMLLTFCETGFPGCFFNLKIGSQPIHYEDRPAFYVMTGNFIGNFGKYRHPVKFEGGQTLNWDMTNNNGLAVDQSINFGVYYNYDWLIEWRKKLSITDRLTAYKQAFDMETSQNQTLETFDFQIAKNLGDPIGFRFLVYGSAGPDNLRWFIFVNGVNVISNASFLIANWDTDPNLTDYYLPLPPGGNITVGIFMLNPAPETAFATLQLFYNGNSNQK